MECPGESTLKVMPTIPMRFEPRWCGQKGYFIGDESGQEQEMFPANRLSMEYLQQAFKYPKL